tara:strand:- start:125 stop:334 length:210 start_codon:yes stop_codon:yes gene_type:complete
MSEKKEKIRVIIDKWYTEDSYEIYRITDTNGKPSEITGNGGFIMYESSIDTLLDDAREEWDIEIVEDYR